MRAEPFARSVSSARAAMQRGIACIEFSAWCLVILPVMLLGIAYYGYAHDLNVMQMIPESIMREGTGKLITWSPNGANGSFQVDTARLERTINQLADRAVAEVGRQTEKMTFASARACYWVISVNQTTGSIFPTPVAMNCVNRGNLAATLDLEALRRQRMRRGAAKPILTTTGGTQGFIPRVVLFGVAVGGQFSGLGELLVQRDIQHGTVWVPREDVYL